MCKNSSDNEPFLPLLLSSLFYPLYSSSPVIQLTMAATSSTPTELRYAREDQDIEACYDRKRISEPESFTTDDASATTIITDNNDGVLNNKVISTKKDDGAAVVAGGGEEEASTTTPTEGGEASKDDIDDEKRNSEQRKLIFGLMPYFMLFVFGLLSVTKTGDGFGNFWHLFAGGCLIIFVSELFALCVTIAIILCCCRCDGLEKADSKLKELLRPSDLTGIMLLVQIYLYLVCFITLVIGARLQHSYHYFH